MRIADFLTSPFSSRINRNGKIFKALIADGSNGGSIERIFNDIEAVRKDWCESVDFYALLGERFEKMLSLFSVISRKYGESDSALKKKLELLFYRNGDTLWGDKWNIKRILTTFFNTQNVWLVNNTDDIKNNLLNDYDFEKSASWVLRGDVSYSNTAAFCQTQGLLFRSTGSAEQSLDVKKNTTYFLHFFSKGKIKVLVKDNNNRYYRTSTVDRGFWSENREDTIFESDKWENHTLFFITSSETERITIIFEYAQIETILDYVRLFEMDGSSTFSVIVQFEGHSTEETLRLVEGGADPIIADDISMAGYFSEGRNEGKGDYPENKNNDKNYLELGDWALADEPKEEVENTENAGYFAEGQEDLEPIEHIEDKNYLELGDWALADGTNPKKKTLNYSEQPYYEHTYMYGSGKTSSLAEYQQLINLLTAGGVTSFVEILIKDNS